MQEREGWIKEGLKREARQEQKNKPKKERGGKEEEKDRAGIMILEVTFWTPPDGIISKEEASYFGWRKSK